MVRRICHLCGKDLPPPAQIPRFPRTVVATPDGLACEDCADRWGDELWNDDGDDDDADLHT